MTQSTAERKLETALEDDEFELFYQPIYEARSLRIITAEALLRWCKPRSESADIESLTDTAEEGSQLFRLQDWAMRTAFENAASWHQAGFGHVRVNLNVSAREFVEADVVAHFDRLVSETGVDPKRLNLEITEKSFIEDPKDLIGVLNELNERGVQLWLDDFGTGHSSITHLQHFPIEGIKIPGTFIKEIVSNGRCAKITRALIDLAHALDLLVVAEGVEKQEQLDLLRAAGCDEIQGFLLSKPMPLDAFREFLEGETKGERRETRGGGDRRVPGVVRSRE